MTQEIPVLPKKTIIKAFLIALLLAGLLLVIAILPAEYNIDPTGVGKALGLTELAPTAQDKPNEKSLPKKVNAKQQGFQVNKVVIEVPAGKGLEYKFQMAEHTNLSYDWSTANNESIYFDFHGEPEGDTTGYFESYAISTATKAKGSMTTPFSGVHGWYWKNTSDKAISITLETEGAYELIGFIR